MAEQFFEEIDVYEQQGSFGGVWNYSPIGSNDPKAVPQTDPHQPLEIPKWSCKKRQGDDVKPLFVTPMYDGLETNIPNVLMEHSDDPSLRNHQLFPTRETVLDYLEDYAKSIKGLVHFENQVSDVRLQTFCGQDQWLVSSQALRTGLTRTKSYDAILVANGHYGIPYVPNIKGIGDWHLANPGVISHSKFYRNPAVYDGKKTVVVGYAASGIDITSQISTKARLPILVSRRSISYLAFPASYVQDVPEIVEFLTEDKGKRAVRFADGRVESDVDAVLFCTGYLYSYPFLPSLKPQVITTGERVEHLYKHIFYVENPTLAFVGLPVRVIPFPTFEGQASVIAKVWARRLELPSTTAMQTWENSAVEKQGPGREFHVLDFPKDLDYHNEMVDWAFQTSHPKFGRIPPKWTAKENWIRERFPAIKRAFVDRGDRRHTIQGMEELGFDYSYKE